MKIYEVNFAHVRFGKSYSSVKVHTRGFVPDAIKKALKAEGKFSKSLRIEEVKLLAQA